MNKDIKPQAKAVAFLQKIDDWIEDRNVDLVRKNDDIERILNMRPDTISILTPAEALSYSFILFSHAEYVQTLYNKEKSVVDFCDSSIWFIVADKVNNYGGQYAKWQEKYYSAVKENPLASELNKLKLAAESRINRLSGKADTVKKMANVLQETARKRPY